MDVDNDNNSIDQNLLLQFNCMGTTDRDELITQLLKLSNGNLNPNSASFFLEMNNWNLQAAVCSYFDYECSPIRLPSMCIDKDELSLEEMKWPPNFRFNKVWTLRNDGIESWPTGCTLKYTSGDQMSESQQIEVNPIEPIAIGQTCMCAVEFLTPSQPGTYKCSWRMVTPTGAYFGDVLWVIIQVTEDEASRQLAEQLARSMNILGNRPDSVQVPNPFQPATSLPTMNPPVINLEDDEDMG